MTEKFKTSLLKIFFAGLNAVKPDEALTRHISVENDILSAGAKKYDLRKGKIRVVGAGKGAAPLASGLEKLLGARIAEGAIVVKYGHALPLSHMEVLEGAHPVPDSAGEEGAEKIMRIAGKSGPGDLLIALLTGGASALLPLPAPGLNLNDLQKTTSLLLASGAAIAEVNAIRKHLSRIGGGQLARAANGADVLAIIVSDVIGDDLAAIASGPTAPDPSTYAECLVIMEKYDLLEKMPPNALHALQKGVRGELWETPKPGDSLFGYVQNMIVASNAQALEAAAKEADSLGYEVKLMSQPVLGEAEEAAAALIGHAKEIAKKLRPGSKPCCILAGGEATVTIRGGGTGGRNQEMALAAAIAIDGDDRIAALFAGTDGTDGPTNADGGFAFSTSVKAMGGREKAVNFLRNNDSNTALEKSGDLLVTGPTLTNVMDMAVILVQAPKK